jgi:hypothetical protein
MTRSVNAARRKPAQTSVEPLDPAVMMLVGVLARQIAREDHAAEQARIASNRDNAREVSHG